MSLLSDFGEVKNSKELKSMQKKYKKLNVWYVKYSCLYNSVLHIQTKNKIEEIYEETKMYLDKGFKKSFSIDFQERLWEMCLIYLFLKNGFNILEKKEKGPDIKILLSNNRILRIEAVVAKRGTGKNFVPTVPLGISGGNIDEIDFPKILRISNSIDYKYRKYFDPSYEKYVNNSGINSRDLYMIAISPDFDDFSERCILNVLFSLGKAIYKKGKNGKLVGPLYEERINIKKYNGENISTNIFESSDYKEISGIIYSNNRPIDLIDKPLGVDLFVGFNSYAKNKISRNVFNFGYHIFKNNGLVKIKNNNL